MPDQTSVRARRGLRRAALSALASIGLAGVAVLAPTAPAGAVTRTVCASGCNFTSIAAATAAAVNGDVITVAAGTYNEPQVLISQKGITLQGAGSGSTIIDGGNATNLAGAGQLSIQTALSASGPISVSGFTIRNVGKTTPAVANRYGILVKSSRATPSTVSLSDIVIQGSDNAGDTMTGIYASGATTVAEPALSLSGITISGHDGNGFLAENWRGPVSISNSSITQATGGGPAAYFFNTDARAERNTGLQSITGSTFTGGGAYFTRFSAGSDQGFDSISVTNNSFTAVPTNQPAIGLNNSGTTGFPTAATITGNTITGDATHKPIAVSVTGSTAGPVGPVTISNNKITGATTGVAASGAGLGAVTLTSNVLSHNTTGLNHGTGGTIDASTNWWGCNSDPVGAAAPCSPVTGVGTTTISNWVTASTSADATTVPSGGTTTIHSALNTLSDASPFTPTSAFDNLPVAFSAAAGSVTPSSGTTAPGTGVGPNGTYTAPVGPGVDTVTTTVDGFAIAQPITVAAPAGNGISGVVTNEVTGQPIAGLQVRLYKGAATNSSATTTNSLGGYSFTKLAAGNDYKLWFRDVPMTTYVSEYYDESTTLAGATPVTVATGTTTIDEALQPKVVTPPTVNSTISGTVTQQDGTTPIPGIQVRLYVGPAYTTSIAATTDASGNYSFPNRPTGSYKLWFRDVSAATWVSEYYNDAPTLAEATPVSLTASPLVVNASLAPVDVTPPPAPGSVSGTVTDQADGVTPVVGIQVRLYTGPAYTTSAATTTDATGHYSFPNKPAGDYKLWFRDISGATWVSEYYDDSPTLAGATVVTVNGDITVDGHLTHK